MLFGLTKDKSTLGDNNQAKSLGKIGSLRIRNFKKLA